MESAELTNPPLLSRWLPIAAVVGEDLRLIGRHWATVGWLASGLLLAIALLVLPVPASTSSGSWRASAPMPVDEQGTEVSLNTATGLADDRPTIGQPVLHGVMDDPAVKPVQWVAPAYPPQQPTYAPGYAPVASGQAYAPATNYNTYSPVQSATVQQTPAATYQPQQQNYSGSYTAGSYPSTADSRFNRLESRFSEADSAGLPTRLASSAMATASFTSASVADHPSLTSDLIYRLLRFHLLLGASFAIAIGASCVCGEADVAAEAILCRGVARWQYFTGKCLSRGMGASILFLLLTVPPILFGTLRLTNDLSFTGACRAFGQASLFIGLLAALAVAGSVWFHNPLIGTVVVWLTLYGVGFVLAILDIAAFSPSHFVDQLVMIARNPEATLPKNHVRAALLTATAFMSILSLSGFSRKDV